MTATTQAPIPAVVQQGRVTAARGEQPSQTRPSPRHADRQGPGHHDPYDLLIIGAGPAGLVAARGAAAAGARVALIESRHIGGNCLNEGCIPSKTILRSAQLIAEMRNAPSYGVSSPVEFSVDFAAVMARMRRVRDRILRVDSAARLRDEGISLHVGHARFVGTDAVAVDGIRLRFRKALIATGARPLLPDIEGLAAAGYLTNETVFELTALPPSLLVIGGGPLGCELAQAFARFGSRTLICHSEPLFLPKEALIIVPASDHLLESKASALVLQIQG